MKKLVINTVKITLGLSSTLGMIFVIPAVVGATAIYILHNYYNIF